MNEAAALLEALGTLLWPIIAGLVIWSLLPVLREIVRSRGFTIKIAGMEVSVQEASDQIRVQIDDLFEKVAELRRHLQEQAHPEAVAGPPRVATLPVARRVLWVDDVPSNNALEIGRLRSEGIEVVEALSTAEAMRLLTNAKPMFAAVISDMGRKEDGRYHATAGLALIRAMRDASIEVPVFVYSSARYAERNREDVIAAGGNGATASPVELFELLRGVIPPAA